MNTDNTNARAAVETLWNGCASPQANDLVHTPQLQELLNIALAQKDRLFDSLTEEQRALLSKAEEDQTLCNAITNAAIFRYAFKLGAWMMLETLHQETHKL